MFAVCHRSQNLPVVGLYYNGTRITDMENGRGVTLRGDVMRAVHDFRITM